MAMNSIVISGASRGLGAALALRFARPGARLLLVARSGMALGDVAARCAAKGAEVSTAALDVRQAAPLAAALAEFESAGPVDLVIANAGISAGTRPNGQLEDSADAARQVEVNLLGAINLVSPLLPGMVARRRGAVALVASVAGFRGLPDCPGYCASKAGMVAWGEALRAAHLKRGIRVTVIAPGFFESDMGDRFRGPRPLLLSLDGAADRAHRAILKGRGRAVFPWPLGALLRFLALLPPALGDRLIRLMRFRIQPEP